MESRGSINLITGPMFSGKTTELLRRVSRNRVAYVSGSKEECLVIVNSNDKRYAENSLASHDQRVDNNCLSVTDLSAADVSPYSHIFIDEGHFFEDVVKYCNDWANQGKTVTVAALNADAYQIPFDRIAKLEAYAEETLKLAAVCHTCGYKNAPFSVRREPGVEKIVNGLQVGGTETYQAVCRQCLVKGN